MLTTLLAFTLLAAAADTPTANDENKTICRKSAATGSFVRQTKTCRTKAEWRRYEQEVRERGRDMQRALDARQRGG